ncbi:MAG: hypothetical protein OQK46_02495 [Gammaproteobacteria bacterium]|nr:hypothetical protein [Gammaproteobacteria bacterium]
MKDYMHLFVLLLFLQACSDDGTTTNITELEGSWGSTCFSGGVNSFKTVINYQSNKTNVLVNTYSDNNCSIITASIPAEETQLVNESTLGVTFEIGNTVTTINGASAKELNYYNKNNELVPNIYKLDNNDTTLYFGLICQPGLINPQMTCTTDRPTELEYNNYFTKIN